MNLAPNGKKSNLTKEQYKLVRTDAFKKWFGDWENDAENSSKVIDSNGEPLVVYHGTSQKFNEFYFKNLHYINGFYFTPSEDIAQDFAEASINPFLVKKTYPIIKECFLNIKNIADYDVANFKKTRNDKSYNKFVHEFIDKNKIDGVVVNKDAVKGGIKLSQKYLNMQELIEKGTEKEQYKVLNREFEYEQYIVFEPNQIKLADGTNTTFDANNNDIRYKNGGNMETEWKVMFESRSGSGNVREVRVSAKNFNDAKKKGWVKSGLNKKFYAFLTAHEIKELGGLMATMQIASTGLTLHHTVKSFNYSIGGLWK